MLDKFYIKSHAKINLFLRVLGKRKDGYHNIRSGITFLDLHDEITINLSNESHLSYSGPFKPNSNKFKNDIILKVLNQLSFKKNIKLQIKIKKNIPTEAGLGSASTNAASLIKGLQKFNLINNINNEFLFKIGADVPSCFYGQNCLVIGLGNKLYTKINFPKYYFVLIMPKVKLSTSKMYSKLRNYNILNQDYIKETINLKYIHASDEGNDFEKIAIKENIEIMKLLKFLSCLDNIVFARMTGSGSCCYAAFINKIDAERGFNLTTSKYSNYWVHFSENNK